MSADSTVPANTAAVLSGRGRLLRNKAKAPAVWCSALLLAGSSLADEYVVLGAGSLRCSQWTQVRESDAEWLPLAQWLQGYLAGRSDMGAQLRTVDEERINLWVDEYCAHNPLHDVLDAARGLVENLAGPSVGSK